MVQMLPKKTLLALWLLTACNPLAAVSARAEDAATESAQTAEWPCVSRKVLEISPAQIWDGPPLDNSGNWNDDDEVRKLSQFLISRRIPIDQADAAIKSFADETPEANRDKRLTLLFAAVLSRVNDERKIVMSGIERFHKRQKARAAEIEKQGIALPPPDAPITSDTPVAGSEIGKISEEEDKWQWEVRVFQERQRNIPIACEIPQLIEERAGEIARTIRGNMKS